jgi:hypothetical protein
LTLTGLARRVHYSKSQLSKVERDLTMPSRELVRLCDAALDAGGELAAMAWEKSPGTKVTLATDGDAEKLWPMPLLEAEQSWFQPVSRRYVMAAGAAAIPGLSVGRLGSSASFEDMTLLGLLRSLFDQYRQLGQTVAPGLLLPVLIAQTHGLAELSKGAAPRLRQGLLILGSRYAEYVGWLVQETGDDQAALWWTRHAIDLAAAGGDDQLAVYGLVRQALVTLYRDDAEQTIALAQRAQSSKVPMRIRGLAAQREAQGHALAGDYGASMRCLDQARTLLARDVPDSDTPVIGTTNLADPAEMVRGWCLHDLGRPDLAAEVIDRQMTRVPQRALRTRVRYGVRRALAYAAAGEVDHACHLTGELLDSAITLSSATVAMDLRKLARTLSRHPRNASTRSVTPRLDTALRPLP